MSDGSVTIETKIDDSGAKRGLGNLGNTLGKVGKGISSTFKVAVGAIAGVSTAISGAIGYGAKYNATIEQYATSFEVMTGSAEKATEVTEKLKKIGAETPFEMTDLADTTQLLMNYGFTADDAISKMQMLGDISQGSADKMNRIATAYGQMSSAGKVQLEDVKQMIEAGFNPLKEISESTGESMDSLYDRISKGTLSVDEITASMERSTSAGGKYFQSMEKQSQTVNGQLSTLKDNASQLMGSLTEGFSTTLGGTVLPMLNEMVGSLQQAFETGGIEAFSAKLGEVFSTLLTNLANSLPNIVNMGTNILQSLILGIQNNLPQLALSAISIIQSLLNFLLTNLPLLMNMGIEFILQLIIGIAQALPELIPKALDCIMTIIEGLIDNIDLLIDAGIQLIIGLAEGLINAIPKLLEKIPIIIEKLINAITNNLPKIIQMGIELIIKLAEGLVKAIPQLVASIPKIISAIIEGFSKLPEMILDIGKNIVEGLWNGISGAAGWLWDKVSGFCSGIFDGIKGFFGIHSPSKLFNKEVGRFLALGIGEGFDDNLDKVYRKMRAAVDFETQRLSANLSTTATTNRVLNANITLRASDIYMDSTKVGRAVTPSITKNLRGAGAY